MSRLVHDDEPLTIEEINEGLEICARLVVKYGEVMLPLFERFERFERDLAAAESRAAAVDRARAIVRQREDRSQ